MKTRESLLAEMEEALKTLTDEEKNEKLFPDPDQNLVSAQYIFDEISKDSDVGKVMLKSRLDKANSNSDA